MRLGVVVCVGLGFGGGGGTVGGHGFTRFVFFFLSDVFDENCFDGRVGWVWGLAKRRVSRCGDVGCFA